VGSVLGVGLPNTNVVGDFDGAFSNALFACCETMGYGTDLINCAKSACSIGAQGSVCFLH
jgi:hypothetical protein